MNTRTSGRGWAYTGALLGGAVSILANVAHSYVPPAAAPVDWTPQRGAVIGAVFWPLALFVAVEIFARTAWPVGRRWTALRFLGLLPVAAVAAVVSYRHLSGLLAFYAEDPLTVVIGPLAVDGLMVMATGALIATGARRAAPVATSLAAMVVAPDEAVANEPAPAPTASEAVTPAPGAPAAEVTPQSAPAPKRAAVTRSPKRQPSAAERVAKAIARSPRASDATIAARLGLSEATVKRHRRQAVDSVSTPTLRAA